LWISRLFANVVSGGFGSRVTAETGPKLKERPGGLAYALTGVAHFTELIEQSRPISRGGLRVGRGFRGIRNRQWPGKLAMVHRFVPTLRSTTACST